MLIHSCGPVASAKALAHPEGLRAGTVRSGQVRSGQVRPGPAGDSSWGLARTAAGATLAAQPGRASGPTKRGCWGSLEIHPPDSGETPSRRERGRRSSAPIVQRSPDTLARASEGRRVGRSGTTRASRGDTRTCLFKHLSLTRGEHVAWEDPRPRGTRLVAPRPPPSPARRQAGGEPAPEHSGGKSPR